MLLKIPPPAVNPTLLRYLHQLPFLQGHCLLGIATSWDNLFLREQGLMGAFGRVIDVPRLTTSHQMMNVIRESNRFLEYHLQTFEHKLRSLDVTRKMTIITKINEVVNQYRILSLIGNGNFGRCYTVEKEGEPDDVMVMKIQKVDGLNEISYKTELEVLRSLPKSHKFSTIISEFAIDTDHKYIVMTYCGISLQTMLMQKENYRFTLENVLRIGIQLFDLVEEFHSLGWLHRDLHWGNVTINTDPDGYISPRRRLETQHVWFYDCYKKIEIQKGSPYNNDYVKKVVMNVLPDFDPYTNITFTEQQEKIIID
ncbi:hypothetical protein CAEBREN_00858 [Caenorhabditis brenneri]|uniref:Protein kinase domain-containing protein n=1 Tax=Caenorhabditis brenneri TaxID=135651 RepID=G0N482_CAEBE|nr:hypothetical protein CAEBREN_00858 [Caenorhabditis brenneri]